jgi:hypothetical protein
MKKNPPWHTEYPLTAHDVQSILGSQFPELACLQIEKLGEGWDNTTWTINDQWVFRFPKHELAAELIQNEIRLLPLLQNLPVSVPKPQFIGQPHISCPYVFYGHAFPLCQDSCRL